MKSLSFWLLAAALLGGCSQNGPAEDRSLTEDRAELMTEGPSQVAVARRAGSFADLPDRGELLDYGTAARRSGAYTWHVARLSEAHAVNAIVTGEMTVAAPDGTRIRLQYDRHVEHDDGNWSWIGTTADGEQALITFGDTAAFGSIPQGQGQPPLRLTMSEGVSWIVSIDRHALARVDNEATDPTTPDYFVPPKLSASYAAALGAPGPASMQPLPAATGGELDLLVGYTQGFASSVGGQAAARTRVQNLVDIANQAYANSNVDLRIRLVHTMQVSYPDATDNGDALEGLTGFRAPSTPIPPAPEFSALRAARDQYGADLVTLVRRFQTPENGGCGIAWLIGGGGNEIVPSDEYFGYSVVADGQDAGTDGTYYCRDETLAHELGHNMGSQHDAGTAGGEPGRYSYSYGYKTSPSAGDFYTVMAYGDSGQTAYRVFSNPRIDFCGGRACGTSAADVARSLAQTSPLVAAFRDPAAVDPGSARARIDFNGDGRADILWRNHSTGGNTTWLSADAATDRPLPRVNLDWFVAGTGDFDGDDASDILWRHRGTGRNAIWLSGNRATELPVARASLQWDVAGIGDFDGDGRDDILWRSGRTGANTIWRSGNSGTVMLVTRVDDLEWTVQGVADFDGDGGSDILWRHARTGANTLWRSGDDAMNQRLTRVNNFSWRIAAAGDFDGDGRADILWRNQNTGANTIWLGGNSSSQQAVARLAGSEWQVAGADDYDGDGRFDILWRNSLTGANALWGSANAATTMPVARVSNRDWYVEGAPAG